MATLGRVATSVYPFFLILQMYTPSPLSSTSDTVRISDFCAVTADLPHHHAAGQSRGRPTRRSPPLRQTPPNEEEQSHAPLSPMAMTRARGRRASQRRCNANMSYLNRLFALSSCHSTGIDLRARISFSFPGRRGMQTSPGLVFTPPDLRVVFLSFFCSNFTGSSLRSSFCSPIPRVDCVTEETNGRVFRELILPIMKSSLDFLFKEVYSIRTWVMLWTFPPPHALADLEAPTADVVFLQRYAPLLSSLPLDPTSPGFLGLMIIAPPFSSLAPYDPEFSNNRDACAKLGSTFFLCSAAF
ncbi:hypothetical protein C8F04DRAFT_1195676 [Mycena alexandri]|uniref:Uncharacterized protein n=1 Tax=Mycena alexandri TaxID=1745969 RepID=A0AAD6S4W6_9AGAR|nr:hypothetical protein C8F04DRAFT_1195676 [Mycena alexandri]